ATLPSGGGVTGKSIAFSLNGNLVGSSLTLASGVATLSGITLAGINAGTYANAVSATFAGDGSVAAASAVAQLTVSQKSLTASVIANNKPYDGATAATIATCSLSGVV